MLTLRRYLVQGSSLDMGEVSARHKKQKLRGVLTPGRITPRRQSLPDGRLLCDGGRLITEHTGWRWRRRVPEARVYQTNRIVSATIAGNPPRYGSIFAHRQKPPKESSLKRRNKENRTTHWRLTTEDRLGE